MSKYKTAYFILVDGKPIAMVQHSDKKFIVANVLERRINQRKYHYPYGRLCKYLEGKPYSLQKLKTFETAEVCEEFITQKMIELQLAFGDEKVLINKQPIKTTTTSTRLVAAESPSVDSRAKRVHHRLQRISSSSSSSTGSDSDSDGDDDSSSSESSSNTRRNHQHHHEPTSTPHPSPWARYAVSRHHDH